MGALFLVCDCTSTQQLGFELPSDGAPAPPSLSSGDASTADAENALISYCPSTTCTNNMATCPGSRFLCDKDLMNDVDNCGACGVTCNHGTVGGIEGQGRCLDGKCAYNCFAGLDCNNDLEDGCEVEPGSNENCNGCGDVCPDPANAPCIRVGSQKFQCGCSAGSTLCPTLFGLGCVDTDSDDSNCSACGHACDPNGGGAPKVTNAGYGCKGGACGTTSAFLKCTPNKADCNKDLVAGALGDGCETDTTTAQNCGGCGIACAPGQSCDMLVAGVYKCRCAPGETRCDADCVDLRSDKTNCGGCGIRCTSVAHGIGACVYGSCAYECAYGWADCNGDLSDGCEANVLSDPTNCGGCGVQCADHQACIRGVCAVEPCPDTETRTQ